MHNHNQIDYFELSATDLGTTKLFYAAAFDWKFTDYGPSYSGFGYAGAGREAGGISHDPGHTAAPLAVIFSENLELTEERVRKAGGKIVKSIFAFPGGRRFHFADPSGNLLAVWSDK